MVWEDELGFAGHLYWNSVERMKGVCYFSCFMYLKIFRPSTKMSENFAALYQSSVIFHSDLEKELSNFAKILTFF